MIYHPPGPLTIRDYAKLAEMARQTPRPRPLRHVKDSSGRIIAIEAVPQPTRPDGPWRDNGHD